MSSEERRKILQMVADGKISAEEAATLMRALDEDSAGDEPEVIISAPMDTGERSEAPEIDAVKKRAFRFSNAILAIGILFTVLFAWAMFAIQQNSGLNFWFYCFSLPLFLGILLIAIGAGSKSSRWLYVNVDRSQSKDKDGPRKISLAFPLPLGLASWFIRTFGSRIDGLKNTNVDDVIQAISMAKNMTDPLIIHVDDSDDGEKVQVFIG
ncbi:MAG: hypothetical protein KF758_09435 [Anaerolineales bacterium]|nr:hypothetical protein [Anaerolineales bacterium]